MATINRVLVTGAAGVVGTAIRPLLAARYPSVVLCDVRPLTDCRENERFYQCDITDMNGLAACLQDVDGVIHLAGAVGPDFTFSQTLSANILGTYHVFEAARRLKVKRVVYTSSHHAVGYYPRDAEIDHAAIPRPDSFYGVSKACGESLAAYYADKHGLQVLTIRVGFVGEKAIDERRVHTWISPRDLMQLIELGLHTEGLGHEIVYGVSKNPGSFFDNSNATRLGYRSQDSSLDHLSDNELRHALPDRKTGAGRCVGGDFVDRYDELNGLSEK